MCSDKQQARDASRRDLRETIAEAPENPSPVDDKNDDEGDRGDADQKQWDPIVVGDKIEEFESVPQRIRPYSPDTLCDGWSCGPMTVRMASVRGYLHRYNGVPRQDDADLALEARTGAVVFAVADGVASASLAHVGAHAACRAAVEAILEDLGSPEATGPDWPRVINAAADAVTESAARVLGRQPASQEEAESLVATTLVAGYLRPSDDGLSGSILQVGDSSAWLLRGGRYEALLAVKESEYLVSSSVFPLPRIPDALDPVDVRLDADSVLLVGTDGFGDPLGDGDGKVGQLFTTRLKTPPLPLEFAHLLDFSRETFDDDRTLIAIWPQPAEWKQH
jgi:hypothetical protein